MKTRRVAIVTGASSGIGRALAERAVRAGYDVFAVGRRTERLDELAHLVHAATGRIATLALDLREPGAAKRIVRDTLAAFGRIDVLVNNAGGVAVGPISDQNDEALYEQMETHVIVPLALTREALPSLRASRGQIVFFGSGVARIPVGTLGAYPPAKAAVRSMARVARNELRSAKIAVTYVDPGAVATEFMTRAGFAGPPASLAASPYDVARAVFAAFTTRQAIVNAVPWQTFFVAVGEALPKLTDFVLSKAPGLVGGDALPPPVPEKIALASTYVRNDATIAHTVTQTPPIAPATETAAATSAPEPPLATETAPASQTTPATETASAPETAPVAETAIETETAAATETASAESAAAGQAAPERMAAHVPPPLLETALAAQAARMSKMHLREAFVRGLLVPGAELDLGSVAMRWAGMPNKHERALTHDVLEALAAAGYLERTADEGYRVLREAGT